MPALVYAVLFAHLRFDCVGSPPPYCRRYLLQSHHQLAGDLRAQRAFARLIPIVQSNHCLEETPSFLVCPASVV